MNDLYLKTVIQRPIPVLIIILAISTVFFSQMRHFKLDASADSLLLDDDADLRYYNKIKRVYGSDDYLLITYQPHDDLFTPEAIARLRAFADELESLESVSSVRSLLDAPLFHSPKLNMFQIAAAAATGLPTLEKESTDMAQARKELTTSPFFKELLISEDGKTTALQLNFKPNETYEAMVRQREDFKDKKYTVGLTDAEKEEMAALQQDYMALKTVVAARWTKDVAQVRDIMSRHNELATLFLGGVPMIASDMIDFVRTDLVVFGVGVLIFLIVTLAIIFRRIRWVTLPLLTCTATVLIMVGVLGWLDWRATVISSNFTSLLFIITMSMAIHIVVRYRELSGLHPDMPHATLVYEAACLVARPCLYCALTTMVGFGSLLVSGIKPINDFGMMMVVGIAVAYIFCFIFFPALLVLLPKAKTALQEGDGKSLTTVFANITEAHGKKVLLAALIVVGIGAWGISRLTVENRFIDYFKETTEIYQGMLVIDENLGGTTPLEIVLEGEGKDYWWQQENLAKLRKLHDFLDAMPETGKVLSLDTMMRVGEDINDGKPINGFLLGMIRKMLPDDLKKDILQPYTNENSDQVRIVVRVQESYPDLRREALLGQIRTFLKDELEMTEDNAHITGMYVLYNNLLQSLFTSQIRTIGMVFFAVWIMFSILFRSPFLAAITIVPNIFPVVFVLGSLGLLGIPLDMMTITIAAITIGIAVDHTIHYIHRFKAEFKATGNYMETMRRCHASIGKAMYYTSVTIIAGFSILALSKFIPTIYFGVFTGMAMIAALLGSMTLLPALVVLMKPLGREAE